jgi:hypothetical protein
MTTLLFPNIREQYFVITEFKNSKYGYDKDYLLMSFIKYRDESINPRSLPVH